MKVLLTGATGFVGSRLSKRLEAAGHEVLSVSRGSSGDYTWAEDSLSAGVEAADAIIHLAGAGLFDKRWSAAYKQELVESRTRTTRQLAELAAASRSAAGDEGGIRRFISASAVGYYGASETVGLDESAPSGDDFLAKLCVAWEDAAQPAQDAGISSAVVRIGIVLGKGGGALDRMLLPFKLGLGGPMGSGKQWMSWVHIDDLCGLFLHLLENDSATGAFNGTAPKPEQMADFARVLGKQLSRPAVLPAPAFAMKLLLGESANVLLTGQHVVPARSQETGYRFQHEALPEALADLLKK